jgi:inosine-uridine nucleoside N-ribohydrolase
LFRAFIHDAVAACALVRPELFAWERLPLKVVKSGPARGVVLSDRRLRPLAARADWPEVEVALRADAVRVYEWISRRLERVADGYE